MLFDFCQRDCHRSGVNVNGHPYRTIWLDKDDPGRVLIIDQRLLPHRFVVAGLGSADDGVAAIRDMAVRGAPLIGATAAWSLYLAVYHADRDPAAALQAAAGRLRAARPTAVNLSWAIDHVLAACGGQPEADLVKITYEIARQFCDEDVATNRRIGEHGAELLAGIAERKGGVVNVLTHCNAGWLATVDWGTATAPMYLARERGIDLHVWVDETRPRNQGAQLTAWELGQQGVAHTVIVDNAGGHLMQHGEVDIVITGTDRTTRAGDVANKIGTYLKALAAHDNEIPFYVAAPSSSIDFALSDGRDIPIEERDTSEVTTVQGLAGDEVTCVRVMPESSPARNIGFDVTPARLVTGLITERGVLDASETAIGAAFPERL